jgi:hypothetical protein
MLTTKLIKTKEQLSRGNRFLKLAFFLHGDGMLLPKQIGLAPLLFVLITTVH